MKSLINSDEETGSFSSAALIAGAAQGKLAALTYEPALPDGTLAGARGGTGNFSLVVHGRSAHAGRNPEDGRNALRRRRRSRAAAGRARRAEAWRSIRRGSMAAGPTMSSPISPSCASISARATPKRSPGAAGRDRPRRSRSSRVKHDVRIDVHGSFNRPPKPLDPGAERLFGLVKQAGADLGLPIAWKATGGVCDGNNIAACGVPVVDTMGARGGAIHSRGRIPDPRKPARARRALRAHHPAHRRTGACYELP